MAKPKIVIVEDESIVAVDLRGRLEDLGYSVVNHVMTCEDALASCKTDNPDLLLLDIHIKGDRDGIETARLIKQIADIPVIFITAYTDRETLTRAKILEPFGYIIKPIQERELASTIELALYKHRTQKQLEEKEALFEVTLGAVTDGIMSVNEENAVLFQNEIAARLIGVHNTCPDVYEYVEKRKHPELEREVLYTKFSQTPVEILQRKSSDHSLTIIIMRDITKSLLSEAQLVHSRRIAEEVSQAKSNFMANMSHELRTPLNSIIGMTDLVLESVDDREIIDYLNISRRASDGLLSLINSILDYSKIEAGRMELYHVPFDLDEVIENVMQKIAIDTYKKGLSLYSNIAAPLSWRYIGDPKRLFQILLNLMWNAVKFTNRGSITIARTVIEDDDDGSLVEIKISDTGVGILPEKLDTIFDAFTQQDGSYTRQHGGTGLGLAIVKNLLSLMRGTIEASSVPGEGSTFTICIPLEKAAVKEEQLPIFPVKVYTVFNDKVMEAFLSESLHSMEVMSHPSGIETVTAELPDSSVIFIEAVKYSTDLAESIKKQNVFMDSSIVWVGKIGDSSIKKLRQYEKNASVLVYPFRRSDLLFLFTKREPEGAAQNQLYADIKKESRITILVAEDDKNNQLLIKRIFEKWGYHVIIASDGHESIEAFNRSKPDIIVMDVQMPRMDGIETAKKIRSTPEGKSIPILALTAHALDGIREQCLSAGMNDYIAKPFNAPELMNKIEYLLHHHTKKGSMHKDKILSPDEADTLSHMIEIHISRLEESLDSSSFQNIIEIANSFKDEIETFGMKKLEALCFKIVLAARNRDSERIMKLITELEGYKR